jgi:hypothetical protein
MNHRDAESTEDMVKGTAPKVPRPLRALRVSVVHFF